MEEHDEEKCKELVQESYNKQQEANVKRRCLICSKLSSNN